MLKTSRVWKLILPIAASLAMNASYADEYHHVNMLIGDRAAGMGGAYSAVSDDAAGLFYNPAGIVYAQGASMSGSMNTFNNTDITYKNVLGGVYNWERSSSTLLPNFFGVVQPLGKGVVGFSYAVPNSIEEDQDQEFENIGTINNFIINFNNNDNTYNFGPSYAQKLNDDLSIGVTLYLHQRKQQRIINTLLQYTDDRLWSNKYFELEEIGMKPVLGMMWSPLDKVAVGASISQVILFSSDETRHETCLGRKTGSSTDPLCEIGDVVHNQILTNSAEAEYPINLNFGAAWFVNDSLLLAADFKYYDTYDIGAVDKRDEVMNIALGAEYYLNGKWALRGGFYTDYANTPEVKQGGVGQAPHVDLYGVSGSITRFTRNSSITLGFSFSSGSGQTQLFSNNSIQDVTMENFSISLASSYIY